MRISGRFNITLYTLQGTRKNVYFGSERAYFLLGSVHILLQYRKGLNSIPSPIVSFNTFRCDLWCIGRVPCLSSEDLWML